MRQNVMVAVAAMILIIAGTAWGDEKVVAKSAVSAVPAKAAPVAPRLALPGCVLEATKRTAFGETGAAVAKLPLATVVGLKAAPQRPAGQWLDQETNAAGQWVFVPCWTEKTPVLDELTAGKLPLRGPVADQPAALLLAGPELNSGELWAPAEIWLDAEKKTITVVAEEWTDNGERFRNAPGRNLFLLNLGKLAEGNWELRVRVNRLLRDAQKEKKFYVWIGLKEAAAKIAVGKEEQDVLPTIAVKDLKEPEGAVAVMGLQWQYPNWGWELVKNLAHDQPVGLRVGNFDPNDHKAVMDFLAVEEFVKGPDEDKAKHLSRAVVNGNKPVYAVVIGPTLNVGEAMTLREAAWRGDELTLKVEVWRDTGGRNGNIARKALVIVPVDAEPLLKAGKTKYTVAVEFTNYVAPEQGGIYVAAAPNQATTPQSVKVTVRGGDAAGSATPAKAVEK